MVYFTDELFMRLVQYEKWGDRFYTERGVTNYTASLQS